MALDSIFVLMRPPQRLFLTNVMLAKSPMFPTIVEARVKPFCSQYAYGKLYRMKMFDLVRLRKILLTSLLFGLFGFAFFSANRDGFFTVEAIEIKSQSANLYDLQLKDELLSKLSGWNGKKIWEVDLSKIENLL
ncbi:MAG: hypothetical protein KDD25_00765, partial [Bdellovibrionales bacterium]|nr:hypothetical protein [Bdellovibrionales bacterium]